MMTRIAWPCVMKQQWWLNTELNVHIVEKDKRTGDLPGYGDQPATTFGCMNGEEIKMVGSD